MTEQTTNQPLHGGVSARRKEEHEREELPGPDSHSSRLRIFIALGVIVLLLGLLGLFWRAKAKTNHVALAEAPKPVTVVKAEAATYRARREYVGTLEPWNASRIGPQFVSAYVSTVLVRPGAVVKRGDVLATLDCRNANAASRETAAQAQAIEEQQTAIAHETQRTQELKQGGFASENEIEQLSAKAASDKARVESLKASLSARALSVSDCILRAPFTGEVSDRFVDPGAYVRPGDPLIHIVDRSTVRVTADAPESDFAVVTPGALVSISVESTGQQIQGRISRRSPAADPVTRTVHFEIDPDNASHALPVGTTGRLTIDVGKPQPAVRVPLRAATVRQTSATVFAVTGGVAKRQTVRVLGERGGDLMLEPKLAAGTEVVVEGRDLLADGDKVQAKVQAQAASEPEPEPAKSGDQDDKSATPAAGGPSTSGGPPQQMPNTGPPPRQPQKQPQRSSHEESQP